MNEQVKNYLEFTIKTFIVIFAVYILMHAFTIADTRRLIGLTNTIEEKAKQLQTHTKSMGEHLKALNYRNTEMLYFTALDREAQGDFTSAAKLLTMALELSQQNSNRYKKRLSRLMQKGGGAK